MSINMKNIKTWVTIISAISKDIKHMNVGLKPSGHQDLKVTTTIARRLVIELLSANQSLCGHQTNQKRPKAMDITTIGTTILGRAITTVRSMGTFLRIALEHISMTIIIGG